MPRYQLSNIQKKYPFSATPPVLDKIVFTIDHIHLGDYHLSSTYEVVKYLTDRSIPVTVFIQCTNPSNDYEFDRYNARLIYALAPHLVTLGVHPLPKGATQEEQYKTLNIISRIIQEVTGKKPVILSYHGKNAGPMRGIHFPGIKFARGIGHVWAAGADDPLNTPVMPLVSVSKAYEYIHERNLAGFSATLFVHSVELRRGARPKRVFDTLVRDVVQHRLQAISYYKAMLHDFNYANRMIQTIKTPPMGLMRLSALTKQGKRPIAVDFSIRQKNGRYRNYIANVNTRLLTLPVGQYHITAKTGNIIETTDLTLTPTQGIHHIFLMPV